MPLGSGCYGKSYNGEVANGDVATAATAAEDVVIGNIEHGNR